MKFHKDGRLFICDYKEGPADARCQVGKAGNGAAHGLQRGFKGLNDLHFGLERRSLLYRPGPDRHRRPDRPGIPAECQRAICAASSRTHPSPNGITLATTDKHVYVGITRSNSIWRLPVMAGRLGIEDRRRDPAVRRRCGPDGVEMEFTKDGLLVCQSRHRHLALRRPYAADASGAIQATTGIITLPILAFGGPDCRRSTSRKSLSGDVLMAKMPVAGGEDVRP